MYLNCNLCTTVMRRYDCLLHLSAISGWIDLAQNEAFTFWEHGVCFESILLFLLAIWKAIHTI